uniref:Uncharacterized protein n=1 Tax=Arundo donax TaxID=35708 RepID=A0A0A8ZGC5_ARUDO
MPELLTTGDAHRSQCSNAKGKGETVENSEKGSLTCLPIRQVEQLCLFVGLQSKLKL